MWEYTDKVQEHFLNPRNVGEIENPNGTGDVGSLACGDALKLTIKSDTKTALYRCKIQNLRLRQRHCLILGFHRDDQGEDHRGGGENHQSGHR